MFPVIKRTGLWSFAVFENDLAAEDGLQHFRRVDVIDRYFEQIAIEDNKVRKLADDRFIDAEPVGQKRTLKWDGKVQVNQLPLT